MATENCQVNARSDAALVLVVRVDGRIADVAAGHPGDLLSGLETHTLADGWLETLWPKAAATVVQQRIRDATRRRTVSSLEIVIESHDQRRTHDVTVLPHGRDRALLICRDTTRRVSLEREVRDLAFRDPVTDLPNRAAFLRELGERINQARLVGRNVCLLRLNLRKLDYVNQTFGRNNGTRLVAALARRAQALLDQATCDDTLPSGLSTLLARTEGNEYAIIIDGAVSTDTLRTFAQRLIERLNQPETIGEDDALRLEVCVGIARFPQDADDIDALLANAGVALYDARKHSASAVEFFSGTAQVRSLSRLDLATELRWALDNDQFHVVYQPWFDLASRRPLGAEALLRWNHPLRGPVPLTEILPVAQMNDLCDALGDWVLGRAANDIAALGSDYALPVAVNLFARQSFSVHLVERATRIIASCGVAPSRIRFEIRAADFLRDVRSAEATARALRDAGFGVTLDDCGFDPVHPRALLRTGITQLKLGRRLVQRLPESNATRVVAAHLGLARPLGIELCATGVQDTDELAALESIGCATAQGFILAEPEASLSAVKLQETAA